MNVPLVFFVVILQCYKTVSNFLFSMIMARRERRPYRQQAFYQFLISFPNDPSYFIEAI
jgi:hypothetical protein